MARSPKLEPAQCRVCGKDFMARSCDVAKGWGKYCSCSCNMASRKAEVSPHWKGGRQLSKRRYVESGKSADHKRRYYAANRERESQRFRETSRTRTGQRLPAGTVAMLGEQQQWRCNLCRKDIRDSYHMDHIIPLRAGGPHSASNLQLLCPPCNIAKGAEIAPEAQQSAN